MGSPDEMADALWAAPVDDADWFRTCTLTELRTLAREAAKQALLEAADAMDAYDDWLQSRPPAEVSDRYSDWLRARAEQTGKETDG